MYPPYKLILRGCPVLSSKNLRKNSKTYSNFSLTKICILYTTPVNFLRYRESLCQTGFVEFLFFQCGFAMFRSTPVCHSGNHFLRIFGFFVVGNVGEHFDIGCGPHPQQGLAQGFSLLEETHRGVHKMQILIREKLEDILQIFLGFFSVVFAFHCFSEKTRRISL